MSEFVMTIGGEAAPGVSKPATAEVLAARAT